MQQISFHIPDAKVSFMLELLQKFDFVKIDSKKNNTEYTLSETQKDLVELERSKAKENPDYLQDWDTVKDTLSSD